MADEATLVSNVKETGAPESRPPDHVAHIAHSRAGLSEMVRRRPGSEFAGQ